MGFIGSDACATCHADISEEYKEHPMSRSLASVGNALPVEDFDTEVTFVETGTPLKYRIERTEDSLVHTEVMTDVEGATIYELPVPVHFSVGSGSRGRSYLIENNGLLFMSPVTWYSQGRKWDLSPGYAATGHLRYQRRISDGCIFCHAGRPHRSPSGPHRYRSPIFAEPSIGCERCHGPGKAHVEHHSRVAADETDGGHADIDPIVNPVKLEFVRREAVCNQCHLPGADRILRIGRSDYDFHPGMTLSEIWTIFVAANSVNDDSETRAVSHVEQMWESVCFQRSNGELGCTSCHDPHRVPETDQRVTFYRDKCLSCHVSPQVECSLPLEQRNESPALNSCMHCHMPRLSANDVPHTAQTDHRILRTRTPTDHHRTLSTKPDSAGQVWSDASVPEAQIDRAKGLRLATQAETRSDPLLARRALTHLLPWLEVATDDIDVLNSAAMSYTIDNRFDRGRQYWMRVLDLSPEDEMALKGLAVLCHQTGDFENGVKYFERLLQIDRWHSDFYGRHAHMLGQLNRLDEGIASAKLGIERNPASLPLHGWLADAYKMQNRIDLSQLHKNMHRRILDALTKSSHNH